MNPAVTSVSHSPRVELESLALLLEKMSVESGLGLDRLHIRRAVDEAAQLGPIETQENWWKSVVEASRSLGLKCKVIDGTFEQLMEMLRDQARLIVRAGDDRQWFAMVGQKGGKTLVLQPFRGRVRRWEKSSRLRRTLGVESKDEVVRCVVFEPQLTGTIEAKSPVEGRTPIGRLTALLQPEKTDIAVIVIFALVTGLLALATPLAVETLVNTVAFGRILQPVVILALMLLAFLSFSAALRALQTVVVEMIQRRLFARVAGDLAYRLPRVELESLDGKSGRELTNRFFDIVTVQKVVAQLLLDGIALLLSTLIGMAVLAFYHPWLLGFDIVLLTLIAFIIFVLGRGAVKTSIKESKAKYQMAAWLENLISCPTAFRHGGAAEFALERSDHYIHDYLTYRKAHFRVLMRQILFALGLQAVASTVLLGLGGWLVMTGQLTLGQLVAAELIVTVIVGSFAKLGKHVESYYDLLASVDKLGMLLDLPVEPQDGSLIFPREKPADVQFHHLSFSRRNGQFSVSDLNFAIEPGDRVVIHGDGGSGKSHLLDLMFGTRSPDSGYISVNDLDPRDLRPEMFRRHVALVRDIEVFDGSIGENVHLERPFVSTQDTRDALQKVGLLDKVLTLPESLDTKLVETGEPLSATQLQKLMIARGIASAPRLLLIDGTLDSFSERDLGDIADVLFDEDAPWTLVLVSGRESLIQRGTRTLQMGKSVTSEHPEVTHG